MILLLFILLTGLSSVFILAAGAAAACAERRFPGFKRDVLRSGPDSQLRIEN